MESTETFLIQPEADDQIDYTESKDITIGAYFYNNFKLWNRVIIDAGFRYSRNKRNRYLKGPFHLKATVRFTDIMPLVQE